MFLYMYFFFQTFDILSGWLEIRSNQKRKMSSMLIRPLHDTSSNSIDFDHAACMLLK